MLYKMGCQHYSVCSDRMIHGVGPYGYTVTDKLCCCDSLCQNADGVGKMKWDGCPVVWGNSTAVSQGRKCHEGICTWILSILLMISIKIGYGGTSEFCRINLNVPF